MITDEKYVSFTTFTRSGKPKPLPVWIADLGDGTYGFTSDADAWKVKRLANNPNITLQPCNIRGVVKEESQIVAGTARAVTGEDFMKVLRAIKAKYGLMAYLIHLDISRWFKKSPEKNSGCAIIVTLNS